MNEMPHVSESPPKMLIADDDPAVVRLLAKQCEKMGFAVETAANGMQLLIKARQMRPDILIVDVNMPELDGLEVLEVLHDDSPISIDTIRQTWNALTYEVSRIKMSLATCSSSDRGCKL